MRENKTYSNIWLINGMQLTKKVRHISHIEKNEKMVSMLIPITLWDDYVDRGTIEYKNKKLKCIYILDIIGNMMAKYHLGKKDKVCLSSEILRRKYGTYYNYLIDYLLDEGILVLEKHHISGKRSKMYRLNTHHLHSPYKHYKCYDDLFIKKNKQSQDYVTEKQGVNSIIAEEIRKSLNEDLYDVTLDIEGAKKYLLRLLESGEINKEKYDSNINTIEVIDTGDRYAIYDKYGRMHTNFTTLKKGIREKFLRISGKKVAESDIKNSQPSQLIGILRENLDKLDKNEYDRYVKFCLGGLLYQKISDATHGKINLKDSKNLVFKVLFGKNTKNMQNKVFFACFPTILKFISEYKKKAGTHKSLAHELQRRESLLIYGKIVKEIKEKYQGIKLFTVHDSIIYPEYYKCFVEEIFNKRIKEEFGLC